VVNHKGDELTEMDIFFPLCPIVCPPIIIDV